MRKTKKISILFLVGMLTLAATPSMADRQEIIPTQDAYVLSSNPNGNYGLSNSLIVEANYPNTGDIARTYVKFDVSSIPLGATINLAYLYIYEDEIDSWQGREVGIYRVMEPWAETGITWNNRPSYYPIVSTIERPPPYGWFYTELTTLVEEWCSIAYLNHGILIKYEVEELREPRHFRSREYVGSEPKLVIIYDSQSIELEPVIDALVSYDNPNSNYGASDYLAVSGYGGAVEGYHRSYLQFDLGSLPTDSSIDFARLRMYQFSGTGGDGYRGGAHRVTEFWQEDMITWNNKPGHDSGAECYKGPVGDSLYIDWIDWDISELFTQWYNEAYDNYGVVVKEQVEIPQGALRKGSFRSREYSAEEYRPRIEVFFPSCMVIPADLDHDCYVDLVDFAIFAGQWLECSMPGDPNCTWAP